MIIENIKNIEKLFIIKISKTICDKKGIDVNANYIGGNICSNTFCQFWQVFDDCYEIKLNKYWAQSIIKKFNLTDDDIEIYYPKKPKIKVIKYLNGKNIKNPIFVIVDRIDPITKRATITTNNSYEWYDEHNYELIHEKI